MKKHILLIVIACSILFVNCSDPFIDGNPFGNDNISEDIDDENPNDNDPNNNDPNQLEEEVSYDDPKSTGCEGCNCDGVEASTEEPEIVENIIEELIIPTEIPPSYDLADLMPPVRSQGRQGSCTAWATTYYLKSFQEKIQYDYDYETFADVMSPAYIYNMSTTDDSCDSGTRVDYALDNLQNFGVLPWEEFPYDDAICLREPTTDEITTALSNKISSYYEIGPYIKSTEEEILFLDLVKSQISINQPIVIALCLSADFGNDTFDDNEEFVYKKFDTEDTDTGCHAMLVVGYDDEKNAFKLINSWGSAWANDGYIWISYDFFKQFTDESYKVGLILAYLAYDEI